MNKEVNFEIAKLLKEKEFSWECSHFYSKNKHDKKFYLRTGTEYDSDRDCIFDWNLNGGKSGILMKIIPYPNDRDAIYYSAPTIAEVVMWLYEKHGIWVSVDIDMTGFYGHYKVNPQNTSSSNLKQGWTNGQDNPAKSTTEAYESAIKYVLENLI